MSRYIDADKIRYKDLSEGRGVCWVTFMDWINEIPTADVVEVVRCRDCKHYEWMSNRVLEEQTWFCHNWNTETGKDDYCSYGERADT